MNNHLSINTKKNKKLSISIIISLISLLISILSLLFNICKWRDEKNSNIPSITVSGDLSYVPFSYESFEYGYEPEIKEEYGRFLMSGHVYITNNTQQGCIINESLRYEFGGSYIYVYSIEQETDYDKKYDVFLGADPFNNIHLNGMESICIKCALYIYLSPKSHAIVKEEFGEDFSTVSVNEIVRYLYINCPEELYYDSPRYAISNIKAHNDEYLNLVVYSNTGASDIYYIDYKNKTEFDYLYKEYKNEQFNFMMDLLIYELSFEEKIFVIVFAIMISFILVIIIFVVIKLMYKVVRKRLKKGNIEMACDKLNAPLVIVY